MVPFVAVQDNALKIKDMWFHGIFAFLLYIMIL